MVHLLLSVTLRRWGSHVAHLFRAVGDTLSITNVSVHQYEYIGTHQNCGDSCGRSDCDWTSIVTLSLSLLAAIR